MIAKLVAIQVQKTSATVNLNLLFLAVDQYWGAIKIVPCEWLQIRNLSLDELDRGDLVQGCPRIDRGGGLLTCQL